MLRVRSTRNLLGGTPCSYLDRSCAEALGISTEEQRRNASEGIPLGWYGESDGFGRAAAFLLSPAASYITGASVQVDGGLVSAIP